MLRRRLLHRAEPFLRATLLIAACASWAAGAVAAETTPPPTVREAVPEIYYLQDDAGRLVPVPGFRYRDFVDLLRIKEGLPGLPEPPPAVLEKVVVSATVPADERGEPAGENGNTATPAQASNGELIVELTVRQSRSGWVSLPLALDGLLITAPPRYEGPGRMLLAAEAAGNAAAQQGGYRLWITAVREAGDDVLRHTIVLTGNIAIDRSPDHESFTLQMPRATASLVELKTSRIALDVSVRPPALPPQIHTQADGAGSIITLVGLAGTTAIRIGAGRNAAGDDAIGGDATRAAVPEAMVESLVRIDGRVAITEAGIRLDNLPADTATIRVSLPPRATLRSIRTPSAAGGLGGYR